MHPFIDGYVNPEWIVELSNKDPNVTHPRAFFLSGPKINQKIIKCCSKTCVAPSRLAVCRNTATNSDDFHPMLFCYFCDRVFHVKCLNLTLELVKTEKVPYQCSECRENCMNQAAQAYYKASGYKLSMIERRKKFLKTNIAESDDDFETDNEYDPNDTASFILIDNSTVFSVGTSANSTKHPSTQSISQQSNGNTQLESENAELKRKLAEYGEKMAQLQNQLSLLVQCQLQQPVSQPNALRENFNSTQTLNQFYASNNVLAPSENSSNHLESVSYAQPPRADNTDDTNDVDLTHIVNRLTISQERQEEDRYLANRRKAMPKITEFNGDPTKWLDFEQDVERYKSLYPRDDLTVKLHVRGSLKGNAFNVVKDILSSHSLNDIMQVLRETFGDPMIMVRRKAKELKELKLNGPLYREDVVKIKIAIQGYFSACTYAKTGCLNSNDLGENIYDQFNIEDRARCKDLFVRLYPRQQIVVNLNLIFDYLTERLPLLDERPSKRDKGNDDKEDKKGRPYSCFSTSTASTSHNNEAYKFEIKDKTSAPYIGYDMSKINLIPKKCFICNQIDHYTLECTRFQLMKEIDRWKIVKEKNLCKNCIISTDHQSSECNLKLGCGFKTDRSKRCTQKHHLCIHNVAFRSGNFVNHRQNRRSNTNNNANRARQIMAETNSQSSNPNDNAVPNANVNAPNSSNGIGRSAGTFFHALPPRNYSVAPHSSSLAGIIQFNHHATDFQRTVKMFKNNFIGPNGVVTEYSIGDSAAEVTLVRDDLRTALGIKGTACTLSLQWTDNSVKECPAIRFDMIVKGVLPYSEKITLKNCYSIEDLHLPHRSLDMTSLKLRFPYLKNVNFESYENQQPVMLIGSPHAFIIESVKPLIEGGEGNPVAIESKLGISVYGGSHNEFGVSCLNSQAVIEFVEDENTVSNEELSKLLVHFNSIESIGVRANQTHMTEKEKEALELLSEEMKVLDDGSIEVPLIWNRNKDKSIPQLINNFGYAYKRQLSQEARLRKNPTHLLAYNKNVRELLNLNYCRVADSTDLNASWQNVWYMPMSLVVNMNKIPPKFRNVYDASARYKGMCLNDLLLKGPDLLIDLLKPLLVMRMNRVAFTADIQHMFHRIRICLRDQQVQRILFRENHDDQMQTLILSAMAFGPSCSPFVSQFVKNWNADKFVDQYPKAAHAIKNLMYMDDLIASESSVTEAIELANQCIAICRHINWNLISFQSNSTKFLKALPMESVKKEIFPIESTKLEEYTTKVLGCSWNTTNDCFVFQLDRNIFVNLTKNPAYQPTKRDLASTIARIYDVMGLIAHFVVRGKILLQRAWKLKLDWDDRIPPDLLKDWREWLTDIENVAKLKIPRMYCDIDSLSNADSIQLHVFCDAGAEAFGCVAYFAINVEGKIFTSLIMSKAKVTPLRLNTGTEIKEIPRLELMSALLAARLSKTIKGIYSMLNMDTFFWTDSEIVLKWIVNPNHRLIKFAISPIEEILELTERTQWNYVSTQTNPADLCTKLKKVDFSNSSSQWFTGPEFLKQPKEFWPKIAPEKLKLDEILIVNNIYLQKLNYATHELPKIDCPFTNAAKLDNLSPHIRSTWKKLVRATARALKIFMDAFVPLIRTKQFNNMAVRKELKRKFEAFTHLTANDLERAEHFLFRKIQKDSFPSEYESLRKGRQVTRKDWLQLNVFMDQEGLIRINSRANLNRLEFPQQFAPLLPSNNEIVHAMLRDVHLEFRHVCLESQIAAARTRCWIRHLRRKLQKVRSACNICNFKMATRCQPKMAPLPLYRIEPGAQPFEVTGVDCLGPLHIKGRAKIWIMIFACMLTRFIHLHILESLESLRVLEAIVQFWAAHGPVRKFLSDNGTNFTGAARLLKEDYDNANKQLKKPRNVLATKLSESYAVDWEFIPPGSPWFGGCYERLIKEVKRSLAEVLTRRRKAVSKIELNIAIHEACHRINQRPLTHNSISADDDIILTPHILAKHRSGWPLLPGLHKNKYAPIDDKSIYKNGRKLADQIMEKFVSLYLPELTRRAKWINPQPSLEENDLVLYITPNNTRKEWMRAKVIKVYKGRDGVVRVADILFGNGTIREKCAARHLAKINIAA
ncbi:uncharacterized protein [Chironomus tepperi]|uniref:uncharacterized protein n=1 Tax=Chironomus tepperi TaxID=113505 RepID=UPI00391F3D94